MREVLCSTELRYRYSPLNVDQQEIRLVKILPCQPRENLRCTILPTQLSEAPSYEALSYRGDNELRQLIQLDGAFLLFKESVPGPVWSSIVQIRKTYVGPCNMH